MAKFTKLNIGEAVASGGGRVWKKLSSMLQLSAPTLSLSGSKLTITDESKLATSFDILADGEVKYTYAKYLYNGVELPPIPNLQGYPYCWIRKNTTSGYYDLLYSDIPFYKYETGIKDISGIKGKPWYRIDIATAETATGWINNTVANTYNSWGVDDARPVFWSNYDIPNGSATATDVYFYGTEPVLSGTNLTSATVDLSTLGLSEGTHNITAISKAGGYADSAESEAVSYEAETSLVGTWKFKQPYDQVFRNDIGISCEGTFHYKGKNSSSVSDISLAHVWGAQYGLGFSKYSTPTNGSHIVIRYDEGVTCYSGTSGYTVYPDDVSQSNYDTLLTVEITRCDTNQENYQQVLKAFIAGATKTA